MSTRPHYQRKAATSALYAPSAESDDESDREWGGGSSSVKNAQNEALRGDETDLGDATAGSSGDEFRLGQARRKKARKSRKKAIKEHKASAEAEEGKKPSLRKRGKRVGKLEAVKLVPVEILLEIFSHLRLADLLTLSMIDKRFRGILTGNKSAHVWRQARARYGLPEVTSGNFSSLQYAQLVCGTRCQTCNKARVVHADFAIRKRLCKACRSSQLVRLDYLKRTHPAAHPLVRDCVVPSLCTPNNMRRLASNNWALLSDVEYWSNRLWQLEYASAHATNGKENADKTVNPDVHDRSDELAAADGKGRRSRKRISYAESDSESETVEQRYGRCDSVRHLVQERVVYINAIVEDGRRLHVGERKMLKQLQAETSGCRRLEERYNEAYQEVYDRIFDIESRILSETDDFSESDLLDKRFFYHPLISSQAPLADDGWDVIKDDVFSLIAKNRKLRAADELVNDAQARQRALRPRYQELYDSIPPAVQPFMPLFTDFLLFESVRPLWSSETAASDQAWLGAFDLVKEECDSYRVDLVALARTLAIHGTDSSEQAATEIDLEPSADLTAKTSRTESFVACAFENCDRCLPWYTNSGQMSAVGPLHNVLVHQHDAHNSANELKKKTDFKSTAVPGHHLRKLPLELVCALSALVDLAQLEPETATKEDLAAFDATVSEYEWENRSGNTRRFFDSTSLLATIKRETERARKFGLHLEPPVIVAKFKAAEGDANR